jgi:hypothetical protein
VECLINNDLPFAADFQIEGVRLAPLFMDIERLGALSG